MMIKQSTFASVIIGWSFYSWARTMYLYSNKPLQRHSTTTEEELELLPGHYTFLGNCPPTPPLSQHFSAQNNEKFKLSL